MADEPPEDVTKEQLWNRLRRLERAVFPSRRDVIKAGAGVGALGAAGLAGRASATPGDDGDTVWGSDANRDDYYADEVDANLVSADDLSIEDADARYTINSSLTLSHDTFTRVPYRASFDDIGSMDTGTDEWSPDSDGTYVIAVYGGIAGVSDDRELSTEVNGDMSQRLSYTSVLSGHVGQFAAVERVSLTSSESMFINFRQRRGTASSEDVDAGSQFTRMEIFKAG